MRPSAVQRQARAMLRVETQKNLPRRWRLALRLPRWSRSVLLVVSPAFARAWRNASVDAESRLPRRFRRALRGDLMLPARERS